MQQGTIEKIISYYLESEKFQNEIERAKKEFFNSSKDGIIISIDEKYEPYFMEWLIFDFRLQNGKSLVEDYYHRNPRKRPLYEMQVYRDLLDNVYGMAEVQKVCLDEGLDLLMLHTGKKYFVHEHSATFQLKKGNLIFIRIAKINGQYELASADSFVIPIHLDSQSKKHLINKDKKFTPKDVIGYLSNDDRKSMSMETEKIDINEIKIDFNNMLNDLGISGMVSADLVQKWLVNIDFKGRESSLVDILVGLTENWPKEKQLNRLIKLSADLANYSPQKVLNGKTPQEMAKENEFGSKGFKSSIRRIGGEWPKYANKATGYLKDYEVPKALNYFEKTFKTLLKEKTTGRYIFSVFANTGVCYLNFGIEFMARKLFEISLELNRNYEFGQKMLSDMDSERGTKQLASSIRFALERDRSKELKSFRKVAKNYSDKELRRVYYEFFLSGNKIEWESHPAKKYYDFLKQLEIDFSKE
jgi:hypothetical protein